MKIKTIHVSSDGGEIKNRCVASQYSLMSKILEKQKTRSLQLKEETQSHHVSKYRSATFCGDK